METITNPALLTMYLQLQNQFENDKYFEVKEEKK